MSFNISIISGGQTGADRASLDFAIKYSLPHGGWCPKGRLALDGALDAKYQLKETPSEDNLERTEWNVRDSDATVAFTLAPKAAGGTAKTLSFARKQKKPCLHLHRGILGAHQKFIEFLEKHTVRRLNIAGSAESEEAGIYDWVGSVLEKVKVELERREQPFARRPS